eukprot:TRINITY_DN66727_c0_g1_i1.p1 TRINITY_DN66727_c0_g1~~TRINITY_DN66727_c0_g1_i1.p1  ORF type:complete len:245 (+),score=33.17 TRINITY_DN66727_c0_g1_i1:284-1018(+)
MFAVQAPTLVSGFPAAPGGFQPSTAIPPLAANEIGGAAGAAAPSPSSPPLNGGSAASAGMLPMARDSATVVPVPPSAPAPTAPRPPSGSAPRTCRPQLGRNKSGGNAGAVVATASAPSSGYVAAPVPVAATAAFPSQSPPVRRSSTRGGYVGGAHSDGTMMCRQLTQGGSNGSHPRVPASISSLEGMQSRTVQGMRDMATAARNSELVGRCSVSGADRSRRISIIESTMYSAEPKRVVTSAIVP